MTPSATRPSASTWFMLALAWFAVALPLLWGVAQTVRKALPLFQ